MNLLNCQSNFPAVSQVREEIANLRWQLIWFLRAPSCPFWTLCLLYLHWELLFVSTHQHHSSHPLASHWLLLQTPQYKLNENLCLQKARKKIRIVYSRTLYVFHEQKLWSRRKVCVAFICFKNSDKKMWEMFFCFFFFPRRIQVGCQTCSLLCRNKLP